MSSDWGTYDYRAPAVPVLFVVATAATLELAGRVAAHRSRITFILRLPCDGKVLPVKAVAA